MKPNIRIKGLVKWIIGTILFLALTVLLLWLNAREFSFTRWLVVLAALPGAYALAGLIELISGTPLGELSKKWSGLAGWQKGVLGVVAVVLVLFLLVMIISMWDFMGL